LVRKILLVFKGSPRQGGKTAEGFRVATAMIAMDVLPQILFLDDGVLWLVKKQASKSTNVTSMAERLKTISDLAGLQFLGDSLTQRKLRQDDLDEGYDAKSLTLDEAVQLVAQNDTVITF